MHKKLSGVPVHTWLLLFAICMVGYWPVSSNLFSLKNDALVYFLPCRHFISESIQSGHLPLWSPYFYMGFPMHGDMQSGAWNPIVLLISLFGKYNMTTLQYETLLYVFIAGIGMYKLLGVLNASHQTKLVLAVAYMFCGFIIDTGQIIVWTASAAFIPFVCLYYYRILYQREHVYKNALKTAIAFYFLFSAGYPSFFIMSCYILLASLLTFCITKWRNKGFTTPTIAMLARANILLLMAFLLLALPALLSYRDYFPYYQRSSGTTLLQAQENPFNLFGIISYFFPLSVTRDHPYLTTNPTARSGYIGLFTIVLLIGIFFRWKLVDMQKFIIAVTIFIFVFSLGDALPIRAFSYHYLPLMNFFRHPGTMRLFTTIGLLMLTAFYMDNFFVAVKENKTKSYVWLSTAVIFFIGFVIIFYFKSSSLAGKISSLISTSLSPGNIRAFLKYFYDSFSFADAILLEGIIQLIFLLIFILLIKRNAIRRTTGIMILFIINPVLLAQFSIPSTFVTRQPPSVLNQFISVAPQQYPLPDLNEKITENDSVEKASNHLYGLASFYTKKIVHANEEINPSYTKSLRAFDSATSIASVVTQYPVCYFADTLVRYADSNNVGTSTSRSKILFVDDTTGIAFSKDHDVKNDSISIKQFAPWGFIFEINTQQAGHFVLFQNFNKNWQLLVDGKNTDVKKGNISFMYADIDKGQHLLEFYYRPPYIYYSLIVASLTALLIMLFLSIDIKTNRQSN